MAKRNILIFVGLFLIVGIGIYLYNRNDTKTRLVPQLTVGFQNSPSNSLLIIANAKGFFDTTKVKVAVKEFSAGKLALQALLGQAQDLDVAVAAETPVALSTLGGNKVKVFSEIVNAKNECRMVVRKDGNLLTPKQYFSKKRKVTTSLGGSPEWFTYKFIQHYNLDKNNIEIISMLPENMPIALSNGSVDAISIFDPFARIGETQLGDSALTLLNTDITSYYLMIAKENTISMKSEAIVELVKGLIKASNFIKNSPQEAKEIIAAQTKLDIGIINKTWGNYSFNVGLNDSLANLLIAESNWAVESGKYPIGTAIPNFNSVIYPDILKGISIDKLN